MQKIAILYDASQAVLSTFDLDEVLRRILFIARDYFHLQNVAILLLDKETNQLCMRSQSGGDDVVAAREPEIRARFNHLDARPSARRVRASVR